MRRADQVIGMKHLLSRIAIGATLAMMLALGGCAKSSMTTSGNSSLSNAQLQREVGKWQKRYSKAPADTSIALQYASALRAAGRKSEAVTIMAKVAERQPQDREVLSAYGKALAGAGQYSQALAVVKKAQAQGAPDWKLHSAQGVIHDQLAQPRQARLAYARALELQPNEPSVLSNLGMSYLLTNDLRGAETYLRRAAARPDADARVRQNLALVIGLQGRVQEAEAIAAGTLDSRAARANVALLRQMLSEQGVVAGNTARSGATSG